ncbi:MAG TPA: NAD-dependent epimerase/dehydratase family protein [Solirubrobacteraceae bacterium]|nr:NAD-dependent epimerase/dehydratase family protein [Solirubrobacteraceae bacterium]
MPKTLVTGASGLIGSNLVRALLERGDDVRLLLRPTAPTDNLDRLACERTTGDILDRRSVRRALREVERVFHVAGTTSLRKPAAEVYRVNVDGTRIVLEECLRAGVERVVHTSSVAAVGPAERGSTADETQLFEAGAYGIPYVNAKHEAEVQALRMAARGLPVVIVNPGHVFGRGDVHRSSTDIVRRFLRRQIPAYVDGALNIVDVRDVARGQLAADEHGVPGERYILGNRNYTLDRLFADLGRVSGVEPPALKLPLPLALAFAEAEARLPGRASITPVEVRAAGLWWTVRSNKAKRELGWRPSPHEDTIEATVDWYRQREGDRCARPGARQPVQLRAAGLVARQVGGLVDRVA